MLTFLDGFRGIDLLSVFIRMVLSCLCGATVGLERSAKNRPAGFRTHILVCLGAMVASLTGLYLYLEALMPSDISRISGQVISGLGFIGAGTIIVTKKLSIKGLTTAGLWTTGIVGLAIGSGYYELAILGTALILMAESWFFILGKRIQHHPEFSVELTHLEKTYLDNVLRLCKNHHMSIVNLRIHTVEEAEDEVHYTATVDLRGSMTPEALLRLIRQMPIVL
ncbi:MAG: MgtC/SapB family protein [Clostridia bacterium]|nr:MgtC/SapB family protein [Clostridia bacterium]